MGMHQVCTRWQKSYQMKAVRIATVTLGMIFIALGVYKTHLVNRGETTDKMQRLQQQLNNEIMSQLFSVADEPRVKASIQDAQKRGEVPAPHRKALETR